MPRIATRYLDGCIVGSVYSGKSSGWDTVEFDRDGYVRELTAETAHGTVVLSMPTPAQQRLGLLPSVDIRPRAREGCIAG